MINSPEKGPEAQRAQLSIVALVSVFLVGACAGPALFLAVAKLELKGESLLSFAIGVFSTLGLALGLASIVVAISLPRLFRQARSTLDSIALEISHAARAFSEDKPGEAISHIGNAAAGGAAWYSSSMTRRFLVQAALGLLVAFGGVTGTILLFSQNTLLKEQNEKLDKQTSLLEGQNRRLDQQIISSEGQRRSAYSSELFDILRSVAKESPSRSAGAISPELTGRIIVLTRSAIPYWFVEVSDGQPSVIDQPLSPERGQLLIGLIESGVDMRPIIAANAVFDGADLRGARLSRAKLAGIHLIQANLERAILEESDFQGAVFAGSKMKGVYAKGANFSQAQLLNVNFEEAWLDAASFAQAKLTDIKLTSAWLRKANFADTTFNSVDFAGARIASVEGGGSPVGFPLAFPRPPSGWKETRQGTSVILERDSR